MYIDEVDIEGCCWYLTVVASIMGIEGCSHLHRFSFLNTSKSFCDKAYFNKIAFQ